MWGSKVARVTSEEDSTKVEAVISEQVSKDASGGHVEFKRRSFGDRAKVSTVDLGGNEGIKIVNQPVRYQPMLKSVDRDHDGYITMDDLLDMSLAWHKLRTNYNKLILLFVMTVFLLASGIFMSSWAAVELAKETKVDTATDVIQTRDGHTALIGSADSQVDQGGLLIDRATSETIATRAAMAFANVTCGVTGAARRSLVAVENEVQASCTNH